MNDTPSPFSSKRRNLSGALLLLAVVAVGTYIGSPKHEAHAGPESIGLELSKDAPTLNTQGDAVYATLVISQTAGSGILELPTDGGVFVTLPTSAAVADGGITVGEVDGSGCIVPSGTAGTFTIAARCGVGEIELEAAITNVDIGNTAGVLAGSWSRTRGGVTTQIGQTARKTELVDAGANGPMGTIIARDSAALADTYQFTFATVGSTGLTATVKGATLTAKKILNR